MSHLPYVLAAWLLYLLTERYEASGWIEGFWIVVVCLFAMAIRFDIPVSELKQMLYSYPTGGSNMKYML